MAILKFISRTIAFLLTWALVAIAVLLTWWLWNYWMYTPWTRDANVRSNVTQIAADVSGWVVKMHVQKNQYVKQGDLLMEIDPTRYQITVNESKATLQQQVSTYQKSQYMADRRARLNNQAISYEDKQNAILQARIDKAKLEEMKAELAQSELDLSECKVYAPESGYITNVSLVEGNYIKEGNSVMALVKPSEFYVQAYLEEDKMLNVRGGQYVDLWLMAGQIPLKGVISSIGTGITIDDTEQGPEKLPKVNPNWYWVREPQRIPLTIQVNWPKDLNVAVGMTTSILVNTNANPVNGDVWFFDYRRYLNDTGIAETVNDWYQSL